jgi:hypothetical protein
MLNKDALIARLVAGTPAISSAIRNMTGSLSGSISGAFPSAGSVTTTLGQITRSVRSVDIPGMSALGGVIGSITGNRDIYGVQDSSSTVALFSGIIKEATRYGIPNSFGALVGSINNPRLVQQVVNSVMPTLIKAADVVGFQAIVANTAPGSVKLLYPDVLAQVSTNYTMPPQCKASDYKEEFTTITETYRSIDGEWDTRTRVVSTETGQVPSSALDLTKLQTGSSDFKKIMEVGSQLSDLAVEKFYALASVFPVTDVETELRKQFPYTVIGASQRTTTKIVDPRSLSETAYLQYMRDNTTIQ